MQPDALLAIRSDIAAAVEPEYLAWLTREHTQERLSIDGFVSARIFRSAHDGFGRYLILYELADAGVVDSPSYLERLNDPTPWTTRMMPHLGNFMRGGGRIVAAFGSGYGASLVPIMTEAEDCAADGRALEATSKLPGIVAIRLLKTDMARTTVATNERELRPGDRSFASLLTIEALDREAAQNAAEQLLACTTASVRHMSEPVPVYSMIFKL